MSLRSMTFVTTRPNRCKHLWLSLLQKLIIMITLASLSRWLRVVWADRFATLLSEGLGEVVCPYGWITI